MQHYNAAWKSTRFNQFQVMPETHPSENRQPTAQHSRVNEQMIIVNQVLLDQF
jgi:hypothetical protein